MAGSHPIRIAISSRAVVAVGEDFNDDAPKHLSLTWPQLNDEASQDLWAAKFELFGRGKEGVESSSYVFRETCRRLRWFMGSVATNGVYVLGSHRS